VALIGLVVGTTAVAFASDRVEVVVFTAIVVVVLPYRAESVIGNPVVAALKSQDEVVAFTV